MKQEDFDIKLAEKLNDFDFNLPEDDWSNLEQRMLDLEKSKLHKSKRIAYFNFAKYSAAAVLCGLFAYSLFFLLNDNNSIQQQIIAESSIREQSIPSNPTNTNPTNTNPIETISLDSDSINTVPLDTKAVEENSMLDSSVADDFMGDTSSNPTLFSSNVCDTIGSASGVVRYIHSDTIQIISKKRVYYVDGVAQNITSELDTIVNLPQKSISQEEAQVLMAQINNENQANQATNTAKTQSERFDFSLSSSLNTIANNEETKINTNLFTGGSNSIHQLAMKSESNIIRKSNHKLPVSFGAMMGVRLANRGAHNLALRFGVVYTGLYSEFSTNFETGNSKIEMQQLHYVGVPLELAYRFWTNKTVGTYAAVGGKVDFCVGGFNNNNLYDSDNILLYSDNKRLKTGSQQWSLSAKIGATFKIYRSLSLYVEPGFVWYINAQDKSKPESFFTYSPYNLSIGIGLIYSI